MWGWVEWSVHGRRHTVSRAGTEEPISVESNGHLLYLLALLSHVLHLTIQVIGELLPRFYFVKEQPKSHESNSPPHCGPARCDTIATCIIPVVHESEDDHRRRETRNYDEWRIVT